MDQLSGKNSEIYQNMRIELIRILAHCEAYIDFEADEMSDPRLTGTFLDVQPSVEILKQKIENYLQQAQIAEVIREGFRISILGPPNAGKSTLMNILAQR